MWAAAYVAIALDSPVDSGYLQVPWAVLFTAAATIAAAGAVRPGGRTERAGLAALAVVGMLRAAAFAFGIGITLPVIGSAMVWLAIAVTHAGISGIPDFEPTDEMDG